MDPVSNYFTSRSFFSTKNPMNGFSSAYFYRMLLSPNIFLYENNRKMISFIYSPYIINGYKHVSVYFKLHQYYRFDMSCETCSHNCLSSLTLFFRFYYSIFLSSIPLPRHIFYVSCLVCSCFFTESSRIFLYLSLVFPPVYQLKKYMLT